MKLMSEISAGKNGGSSFGFSKEVELIHDAAAAHALMQAIDDAASAEDGWANIYAERIRKRADEILLEWGFEHKEAE